MVTLNHYRTRRELATAQDVERVRLLCDLHLPGTEIMMSVKCVCSEQLYRDATARLTILTVPRTLYEDTQDKDTILDTYNFVFEQEGYRLYRKTNDEVDCFVACTCEPTKVGELTTIYAAIRLVYPLMPEWDRGMLLGNIQIPTPPRVLPRYPYTYSESVLDDINNRVRGNNLTDLERNVKTISEAINERLRQLDELYCSFNKAKESYRIAKLSPSTKYYDGLVDLIKADVDNGTVNYVELIEHGVGSPEVKLCITQPITYWDTVQEDEILQGVPEVLEDTFKAMFAGEIQLVCSQTVRMFDTCIEGINDLNFNEHFIPHMHLGRYNCPGDNASTYRATQDWVVKYNIVKNILGQWNMYDTCVNDSLYNTLLRNMDTPTFRVVSTGQYVSVTDIEGGILNEINQDNE